MQLATTIQSPTIAVVHASTHFISLDGTSNKNTMEPIARRKPVAYPSSPTKSIDNAPIDITPAPVTVVVPPGMAVQPAVAPAAAPTSYPAGELAAKRDISSKFKGLKDSIKGIAPRSRQTSTVSIHQPASHSMPATLSSANSGTFLPSGMLSSIKSSINNVTASVQHNLTNHPKENTAPISPSKSKEFYPPNIHQHVQSRPKVAPLDINKSASLSKSSSAEEKMSERTSVDTGSMHESVKTPSPRKLPNPLQQTAAPLQNASIGLFTALEEMEMVLKSELRDLKEVNDKGFDRLRMLVLDIQNQLGLNGAHEAIAAPIQHAAIPPPPPPPAPIMLTTPVKAPPTAIPPPPPPPIVSQASPVKAPIISQATPLKSTPSPVKNDTPLETQDSSITMNDSLTTNMISPPGLEPEKLEAFETEMLNIMKNFDL